MLEGLVCWKCGAAVMDQPLPLSRYAECALCHADLHVCRLCEFYDPRVSRQCREPIADEVQDKVRANFCGYFQARPAAYHGGDDAGARARAELERLFGGDPAGGAAADPTRAGLDALFGGDGKDKAS